MTRLYAHSRRTHRDRDWLQARPDPHPGPSSEWGSLTRAWLAEGEELSRINTLEQVQQAQLSSLPPVRPLSVWQSLLLAITSSLAVVGILAGLLALPSWITYLFPSLP